MPIPETAVNENRQSNLSEHQIWVAGKMLVVEQICIIMRDGYSFIDFSGCSPKAHTLRKETRAGIISLLGAHAQNCRHLL
jgi:hypothetical protein